MTDKEMREPLFDYLEEFYGKIRIFEEKNAGASRADVVAVIDGALLGFEIKSDRDSYTRLKSQTIDYDDFCDMNFLVVGKSHLKHGHEHIPEHWGMIVVWEDETGAVQVEMDQLPAPNPNVSLANQLSFLWRPELAALQEMNELPVYKQKSKQFVQQKILEKVPEEVLKRQITDLLFERDYQELLEGNCGGPGRAAIKEEKEKTEKNVIKSRENFGMNYYRDFVRKTLVGYTYSIVLFLFLMMIIVFVANIMWFSVGKNQNNNKKITKILNEQINAYKEGIQELVTDDTILDVFRYPDKEHITSANRVLYSFVNGQAIRSSFCLAESNGNVVCSNLFLDNQQIFMNNTMVKYVEGKLQENTKEVYLLPSDLGYQYKQTGDFIIASGIVDQGELVGYLFFDVYDDAIYQTVKSFPLDDIVITDRYDTILFSLRRTYSDPLEKFPSQKFQIASDSKYIKIDGIHYQVSVNRVDDDLLIIYTLISLEFQRKMMPVCLLFLLLLGGFIGIILHPLNSRITNKNLEAIEELRKSIEEMGNGNMEYELQTQVFSEFKDLNEAYRNVIIQREELLQHNSELTERKRIMEIKQLEEQFNPHFIFNVLETLRYEILIDSAKASDMVVAFANLMRYSINYGNEQVSLETDIEYINDYLLLQKMRYNRRLTYNISIPCELMDCKIPKLVLQPVVENSLSHGMKHVDSIFIQIEAREEEGKLKLIVQDNGCGIDREHLEKLRKSLDEEDALREHIGMYNSHRVVKLIYGSQYGLDIESEPGEGTTVSITMPMEMEL